jgi:Zn-dependent M28 family amino/carboxypeptidase
MLHMPGESFQGDLPPAAEPQLTRAQQLRRHVEHLAVTIGERNIDRYPRLVQAAEFIEQEFRKAGYETSFQEYEVFDVPCRNIEVELPGADRRDEIVIVGGHYDSVIGTPGANDNASGTAATLALARALAGSQPARTLRFVTFVNEEPPYFQSDDMGSLVYARRCRERGEEVVAMLSLETIGYYSDEPGSQQYPPLVGAFYPSEGNFIGVVGNMGSRKLVRRVVELFRANADFPCEGAAVPGAITGVGWSDHWSFWQEGYPAVMITDTAPFRYPYYHHPEDTPDKLDFDRMARVVDGLEKVIGELVNPGST